MSLKDLRLEAESLDKADLLGVTPQAKICIYKNLIVIACSIIKTIIPPLFWGVIVREALTTAINVLNELCPEKIPETD